MELSLKSLIESRVDGVQTGTKLPRTTPTHSAVWMREPTSGPERLRVGGGAQSANALVVMRVPRAGEEGRWESNELTYGEVVEFLTEFRDFFERDARAEVWVGTTTNQGMVVLDEHDLIYAYGPLDRYSRYACASGATGVASSRPGHT